MSEWYCFYCDEIVSGYFCKECGHYTHPMRLDEYYAAQIKRESKAEMGE